MMGLLGGKMAGSFRNPKKDAELLNRLHKLDLTPPDYVKIISENEQIRQME